MLGTIIKKEIQENLYSYKYMVIMLLMVILVFTSLLVMYHDYLSRLERYEDLLPSLNKTSILLQPATLSILAKGMDESLCQQYGISSQGVSGSGTEQSLNSLFRLFDTPDLVYITKIILSLCALLISFRLIAEEKEARTLALTLSHNLRRSYFLIGKWLSGLAGLITPFLIASLTGVLLISLSPRIHMGAENWLGLGMFILSSILYMTFFFSLGLLVSCLYARSSSALVVSLFLWVLLVLIMPSLGGVTAISLSEIPSSQSFTVRQRLASQKQQYEQMQKDGGYGAVMEYPERDKLLADYRFRLDRQIELARAITRITPSAVYTFLATDFAGTGMHERLRLKRALLNFQGMLKNTGEVTPGTEQTLSYSRSTTGEVLAGVGLLNLLILLLQNVVIFSAAYVAFLRYDLR